MAEPTLEQVLRVAEQLIGRPPERIQPFRPAVGGNDSHGFRLWAGGEPMLLKIKKRPGTPVGICFYRRIKEAGVPAPELLAFGTDAGPRGEACVVWQWVDGVPAAWGPGEPCPYDEAELGRLLRRIHDLRLDGPFGFLGDDISERSFTCAPDLAPTSNTWAGFFLCDRAARRFFDKGCLSRSEADILASLPELLAEELGKAEPRLLHMGDIMHNGNMIIDPRSRRILAVVDYVESMAGDPRWELAWVDYYFDLFPFNRASFDMARFRAAYGTDHDPTDATGRFYLAAILLFAKLLWFKAGEPRTRWALDTLKNILAGFRGSRPRETAT